jgi:hypothetical protein
LISKIEPPKIVDLIISKQTQYYTLWAVYTAVQFAAGGFGYGGKALPLGVAVAVLLGVWAFNFGHLGFVLQCISDLDKLTDVLKKAVDGKSAAYNNALKTAFTDMGEARYFWQLPAGTRHRSYAMNIFVHLWIDTCASIALLIRIDNPWIHDHVPSIIRGIT